MAKGYDTGNHPNRKVDRNSYYNRMIGLSGAAIPLGIMGARAGGAIADAAFQQGHYDRPAVALTAAGAASAVGGAAALAHNVKQRLKRD